MNFPSLPKTQRSYETKLWPHKIKYSAFTSGQQSLLLQVADQDTPLSERMDTMSQVFSECVQAGVPFAKLPVCIVEKVFLLMRGISVGEVLKLRYKCNHSPNTNEVCGQEIVLPLDLTKVEIITPEGYKTDFELAAGFWIRMKLPTYGNAVRLQEKADIPLLLATFTECIFNEEESWPVADPDEEGLSTEELSKRKSEFDSFVSWVSDNIDSEMINKIQEGFFNKMPSIYYETKMKCPKCGTEHSIEFNGLNQIFI